MFYLVKKLKNILSISSAFSSCLSGEQWLEHFCRLIYHLFSMCIASCHRREGQLVMGKSVPGVWGQTWIPVSDPLLTSCVIMADYSISLSSVSPLGKWGCTSISECLKMKSGVSIMLRVVNGQLLNTHSRTAKTEWWAPRVRGFLIRVFILLAAPSKSVLRVFCAELRGLFMNMAWCGWWHTCCVFRDCRQTSLLICNA